MICYNTACRDTVGEAVVTARPVIGNISRMLDSGSKVIKRKPKDVPRGRRELGLSENNRIRSGLSKGGPHIS